MMNADLSRTKMNSNLISPHGGMLMNLVVDQQRAEELKGLSLEWPCWYLTPRQLYDLELLANGGFLPLNGFLGRDDYESVCKKMRLTDGTIWPIPIVLDIPEEVAKTLKIGSILTLRDPEGVMLAALNVKEIWKPDLEKEAKQIYGTTDNHHPGVAYLKNRTNAMYVGGKLECLQLPTHYDSVELRQTPLQLREQIATMGWQRIVGFQTRNPMHRAHQALTARAASELEANLLIHPVVGITKPGDVDHYTRVRCYKSILKYYDSNKVMLSLLPLAMRLAGPREAILHAIIRKNYGCTHMIIGRDHAGPGPGSNGQNFYGPYDAQELFQQHEEELEIQMVPFKVMVYVEKHDKYIPINEVPKGVNPKTLSGTKIRKLLDAGRDIPSYLFYPEIVEELRRTIPPLSKRGFTVFFTGLPSAGKSTLANILLVKLKEFGDRTVTLLDGDIVRKTLSSELGFSKKHRDLNIQRIGFVASEITKNGGVAICAPIAPYDSVRKEVRQMIETISPRSFILIHIATPLEACEKRDRKGFYAKAHAGIIKQFTGISDPFEPPVDAELTLDTAAMSKEECVQQIILYLEKENYIDSSY